MDRCSVDKISIIFYYSCCLLKDCVFLASTYDFLSEPWIHFDCGLSLFADNANDQFGMVRVSAPKLLNKSNRIWDSVWYP